MNLTFMCVAMVLLAGCQCFHTFKVYRTLAIQQMIMDSILRILSTKRFNENKEVQETQTVAKRKRGGGNHSEATKAASSQRLKDYWAKRRASEAKAKEALALDK